MLDFPAAICPAVAAVLPLLLQPVKTFTMPAFSYVHIGNAFESSDGTTLHVDLAVYPNANILNDLKLSSLKRGPEEGREVTRCEYMRMDIPLDAAQTHLKVRTRLA